MPIDNHGPQPVQNWNPVLRPAELTALVSQLQTIEEALPFLIGLTAEERGRLSRVGTRTEGFLQAAITTAVENPGLLPASLPAAALQTHADTLANLRAFKIRLDRLQEKVFDTERLFSSQLYGVTRTVYAVLKSPMRPAGLNERRAQLAQRFARRPARRAPEEVPVAKAA